MQAFAVILSPKGDEVPAAGRVRIWFRNRSYVPLVLRMTNKTRFICVTGSRSAGRFIICF